MQSHIKNIACCLLASHFSACANTNFAGGSGGGNKNEEKKKSAAVDQASNGTGNGTNGLPTGSGTQPGNNGNGNQVDGAQIGNPLGPITSVDQCLNTKADSYNIVLIFDNSGSQTGTDPDGIRRVGAYIFVDQFESFVQRNPAARVRMAVISFNTASLRGARGWMGLTGVNHADIKDEIAQATSYPDGGTAYSPALNDAALYFDLVRASGAMSPRSRNYVVFLTDGEPSALDGGPGQVEQISDINAAVANLVQAFNVAIIAVASGAQIKPEGQAVTEALAQPRVGIVSPDHVGIYRRAATPNDLNNMWQSLFQTIGDCR